MMHSYDFLVVGAGIGGAGLAYYLSQRGSVAILDMEAQAGYHTTGRSAAFYAETYGGPKLQPLTTASKAFLTAPPAGFSDVPLMTKHGAIHLFTEGQRPQAEKALAEMAPNLPGVRMLGRDAVLEKVPCIRPDKVAGGIDDPDCSKLDVAALHHGYLRASKKKGARLLLDYPVEQAVYRDGLWHVTTPHGLLKAAVLINAAGAWGDVVAERAGVKPIGLQPLRRTIIKIPNPAGLAYSPTAPVVIDIDENFYFKPEGNGYLVSPADEILSPACDTQPELEDVAIAADYFEQVTGAAVQVIENKWAGLRTFAPDRTPVIGFAADHPAFFWNVGQGGYGIQTAPAWSLLASSLICKESVPDELLAHKVQAELYSPGRFAL